MASDARYTAAEHGGLELAARDQEAGLEVVHDEASGPQVVSAPYSTFGRKSSLDQPEVFHPGQYGVQYTYLPDKKAPPYVDDAAGLFPVEATKEEATAFPYALEAGRDSPEEPQRRKRYCGLSWPLFVAALIAAAVVVAAVLGGVLGGVLGKNKSSSSSSSPSNSTSGTDGPALNSSSSSSPTVTPLKTLSNTGLASTFDSDGSGRLVTYYQDPSGRIIENSLLNGTWTLSDASQLNNSVVTQSARVGTPLAAVSYALAGQTYRQLFFLSSEGYVQSVNSSATDASGIAQAWTTPVTIAADPAVTDSVAMAACADSAAGGMTGIRMYYGSQKKTIQEVGYNFSLPHAGWTEWEKFGDSDPSSGVACTLHNSGADRWISVYYRNVSSAAVEQQWWNYRYQNGWSSGPSTAVTIEAGSDVAACNDGEQTDYVFYQIPSGTVTRAIVAPAGASQFLTYNNQPPAASGSRLAAAYIDGGSMYMFQNSSSSSTVWAHDVSRSGAVIADYFLS